MSLSDRYRAYTERVLRKRPRDLDLYRNALAAEAERGDRVLHLGCGWDRSEVTAPLRDRMEVIGVDIDPSTGPRFHSQFWCADAANLPFADATFDLACSEYVFEHVDNPSAVMRELARVLRPGGHVVALTPSRYSYKSLVAALTPHWFHRLAAARFRPDARAAEDVYPTRYLMNSLSQLRSLARDAGLELSGVTFINNGPTWFRRMPGLFEAGRVFHRALDSRLLEQLRCGILVALEKPVAGHAESEREPLAIRCIVCGAGMQATNQAYRCASCHKTYPRNANIVDARAIV